MPAYKSFRYKASTSWSSARRGMLAAPGKPDIVVGSPPEFKGEPDIWAPEELLVGSLNTCMMLTFLTLAQAQGLIPVGYESEAEDLLENVEEKYHITEVTVRPRVTLKSEAELEPARKIMESVEAPPTASSQIRLRPGWRSRRSLSLLPHQRENVSLFRQPAGANHAALGSR